MQRTLVYSRIDTDEAQNEVLKLVLQAELDRLAVLYGMPTVPAAARRFTFVREFPERTPDDVGGAGYCRCWPSSLGSLGVYVERFRGSDDQAAEVEKRLQAADRLVALLRDWLETRLGRAADWDRLRAFLADAAAATSITSCSAGGPFRLGQRSLRTAAKDGWFTMARVLRSCRTRLPVAAGVVTGPAAAEEHAAVGASDRLCPGASCRSGGGLRRGRRVAPGTDACATAGRR